MTTIQLHKHVNFGDLLLLVSDCHQVHWDISKAIELQWNPGDIWVANIDSCCLPLTYKYVVVNQCSRKIVEWEDGDNRTVDTLGLVDDYWGQVQVVFKILSSHKSDLYLQLFGPNIKSTIKTEKEQLNDKYLYRAEFFLPRKLIAQFAYKFSTSEKWDRGQFKYIAPLYKQYLTNNTLYYQESEELDLNLNFSQIRHNIYVGPYIYLDELNILKKQGITAILNLQTVQDIINKDLPEDYFIQLKNKAKNYSMEYKHFPIKDVSKEAFFKSGYAACQLLRDLLLKGHKVYVHCTLGVQRSVQTILLYMVLYENYSLNDAIKEMQRMRPQCNPMVDVLKKILNNLPN